MFTNIPSVSARNPEKWTQGILNRLFFSHIPISFLYIMIAKQENCVVKFFKRSAGFVSVAELYVMDENLTIFYGAMGLCV